MSARARALTGVIVMAALLVLYFFFAGVRAVALLVSGTPVALAMGVALLVLPLIGAWALIRELRFGWRSTQLVDRLDAEGRLPDDLGETGPTGKPNREIADSAFPHYRKETEANPSDWRAWMRLGLVYDACGDRKRARSAIRQAIRLERDGISGANTH
ncbi:tetratricopeptide repeat protein [Leucobacter sp. W1153]|uniref:tetratricopeptide repeat protein n=1 Tax=unclassified Leucobacter TaxID=2621730 RepID=UPI003F3F4A94